MEWISRAVKKRIFAMAVLLSCLLGISIASCDLALNLAAETSVSQTTLLWLLAAFCIVSSVAAILHGILAADNGKGKSTRGVRILTRVLFWGLLLIFPCLLAEGHSYYIRGQQFKVEQEKSGLNDVNPYRTKQVVCDVMGFSGGCGWVLWIWWSLLSKASGGSVSLARRIRNKE